MPVDERIATHEAGHALAILLKGGTLHKATAGAKGGSVNYDHGGGVGDAVILAAGIAAEMLAFGDCKAAGDDMARLRALAESAVPPGARTTTPLRRRRWAQARVQDAAKLLRAHRPRLRALTEALIREGTLTGAEAHAVATGKTGDIQSSCGCSGQKTVSKHVPTGESPRGRAGKATEPTAAEIAAAVRDARAGYRQKMETLCERFGHEAACSVVGSAPRRGVRSLRSYAHELKALTTP